MASDAAPAPVSTMAEPVLKGEFYKADKMGHRFKKTCVCGGWCVCRLMGHARGCEAR